MLMRVYSQNMKQRRDPPPILRSGPWAVAPPSSASARSAPPRRAMQNAQHDNRSVCHPYRRATGQVSMQASACKQRPAQRPPPRVRRSVQCIWQQPHRLSGAHIVLVAAYVQQLKDKSFHAVADDKPSGVPAMAGNRLQAQQLSSSAAQQLNQYHHYYFHCHDGESNNHNHNHNHYHNDDSHILGARVLCTIGVAFGQVINACRRSCRLGYSATPCAGGFRHQRQGRLPCEHEVQRDSCRVQCGDCDSGGPRWLDCGRDHQKWRPVRLGSARVPRRVP
jgi:hypothetical protein